MVKGSISEREDVRVLGAPQPAVLFGPDSVLVHNFAKAMVDFVATEPAIVVEAKRPRKSAASRTLEARVADIVAKVLTDSLAPSTQAAHALRMALLAELARFELGTIAHTGDPVDAPKPRRAARTHEVADPLLGTAEVASRLGVSRPYVTMLCDAGKLGPIVLTDGGHRRVRTSSVDAWLAERAQSVEGAIPPREAGVQAHLYDRPDSHYTDPQAASPGRKRSATRSKRAQGKTRA
jgi:excisionase family DNA binding protein